jgi:hypothetical protein
LEKASSYEIAEVYAYFRLKKELEQEEEQRKKQAQAQATLKAMFSQ